MARRRDERGVALLLVLWIFMILGVLALDFAQYMRDDAMAAINFSEETRGYYLALAGMNRALLEADEEYESGAEEARGEDPGLEEEEERLVPIDGQWHEGEFAGGRWSVRMIDEGGRIPLRRVEEPLLTKVVTNLIQGGQARGLGRRETAEVATVVDSILDWRDGDSLERMHGAESDYYLERRVPYHAKNGFFDSPEELLLVRGITADLFYGGDGVPGLRDVFSVYSRTSYIRFEGAPPAVLQVLLGVDAEEIAELVEQRAVDGAEALCPIVQAQVGELILCGAQPPRVVTIEARGDMAAERNRSRVGAVVDLRSELGEGVRVLRWLDRAPWTGVPGAGGEAS
jgi:general secretion pathway protein K